MSILIVLFWCGLIQGFLPPHIDLYKQYGQYGHHHDSFPQLQEDLVHKNLARIFNIKNINTSSLLSPFTPLDLNALTSYCMNGTFCASPLIENDPPFCIPLFVCIDPPNKRVLFDVNDGMPIGMGVSVGLQNATYVWGALLFPQCTVQTNFTYDSEVATLRNAVSMIGSTDLIATYTGLTHEMGSCNHLISFSAKRFGPVLYELYFVQDVPIPIGPGGSLVCFTSKSYMKLNPSTIRLSNFDPLFNIREDCYPANNPDSYCSLTYPSNNPCIINP